MGCTYINILKFIHHSLKKMTLVNGTYLVWAYYWPIITVHVMKEIITELKFHFQVLFSANNLKCWNNAHLKPSETLIPTYVLTWCKTTLLIPTLVPIFINIQIKLIQTWRFKSESVLLLRSFCQFISLCMCSTLSKKSDTLLACSSLSAVLNTWCLVSSVRKPHISGIGNTIFSIVRSWRTIWQAGQNIFK